MRFAVLAASAALAWLACVACSGGSSPTGTPAPTGAGTTATARAASTELVAGPLVSVPSEGERRRIVDALAGLPAGVEVSDKALAGGTKFLAAWAVVTDQRRDVLELTLHDLLSVLTGEVDDWADLRGSPLPILVEIPSEDEGSIVALTGRPLLARAARKPLSDVLADVETRPGTFALVPVEELRMGMLALIIDSYDPYRDPATASPLKLERWVKASDPGTVADAARRLGWSATTAEFDPAGVLATGDFIPGRCSYSSMIAGGGPLTVFATPLRDLMREADLTVVPLEVGLMTSNPATPCTPTTVLQGSADSVEALSDAGVDIVTRASNHALDCWNACSGLLVKQETDAVLAQAGIASAGIGNGSAEARTATVIERNGLRFGVLGYDDIAPWYHAEPGAAGTAGLDLATLADDVRAAKARADHVFVAIHAGIEYQAEPTERQREAARIAIEAGASLVIGNHPHWVQAVERVAAGSRDGFVVYALGNFVFDQPWSVPTQQGMILETGFVADRMIGYRLRPHIIRDRYQPTLLDPAGEGAPILERVWEASDLLSGR